MPKNISLYTEIDKNFESVTAAAAAMGISRISLSNYVNQKTAPKIDTARRIAQALRVNVRDIFPEIHVPGYQNLVTGRRAG